MYWNLTFPITRGLTPRSPGVRGADFDKEGSSGRNRDIADKLYAEEKPKSKGTDEQRNKKQEWSPCPILCKTK